MAPGGTRMTPHPFLDAAGRLRSGWWIGIFFAVLAGLLLPLLLLARGRGGEVPLVEQLAVVVTASVICQALRREPASRLVGPLDGRWPREFLLGGLGGAILMALPALALGLAGVVRWRTDAGAGAALLPELALLAAAAATEELLFRGFLFRRLVDGLGAWPAQLLIAALFLLTHSEALRGLGPLGVIAGANIFLASILFGLAYLRTGSLAMPLGLHLAANVAQGPVLGFGVSGTGGASMLVPSFSGAPDWLYGGAFGLEASLPGLACLVALLAVLRGWRPYRAPTP
ncbi:MAG: CPBP family intramembrane glutamic endopeptidase [Anaeromyxobacteraceae bacterium]